MRYYFVNIHTNTLTSLHNLQKVYKLDVFVHTARQLPEGIFEVQSLLSEEQIEKLRADGYNVEVTEDAEKTARERLKDIGKRASQ